MALKVILSLFKRFLNTKKTIVFPPSWEKNNQINHIEELLIVNGNYFENIFTKTKEYKQSRLDFGDRLAYIELVKNPEHPFILFDDIYTSGKTIEKCLNLLDQKGYKNIKVLILATNQHEK